MGKRIQSDFICERHLSFAFRKLNRTEVEKIKTFTLVLLNY